MAIMGQSLRVLVESRQCFGSDGRPLTGERAGAALDVLEANHMRSRLGREMTVKFSQRTRLHAVIEPVPQQSIEGGQQLHSFQLGVQREDVPAGRRGQAVSERDIRNISL